MAPTSPPAYRTKPLRIACVQFDPKLGEVEANIRRCDDLLKSLRPGAVDLVVVGEMAFSGYCFTSPAHIAPFLEPPRIGPTALFGRALAQRIQAHVIIGYPEQPEKGSLPDARGYNSAMCIGPGGEVLHNYRKTFLYETDEAWAAKGDGFSFVDLPPPIGRVCLGICMDINPDSFKAPWDAYELSNYAATNEVDVLVLCAAWLAAPPADPNATIDPDQAEDDDEHPDGPSLDTLNYWAHRLTPLHDPPPPVDQDAPPRHRKTTTFVACNRVGKESGSKFVGTSTVFQLTPPCAGEGAVERSGGGTASIEVLDCLGKTEESVLFVTIP